MDDELEETCIDNGYRAERGPELGGGVFEVGVFRSFVHHAVLKVEAVTAEAAEDHARSFLYELGADANSEVIWNYAHTVLGVRYVQREEL
jgi:hypothetical protein